MKLLSFESLSLNHLPYVMVNHWYAVDALNINKVSFDAGAPISCLHVHVLETLVNMHAIDTCMGDNSSTRKALGLSSILPYHEILQCNRDCCCASVAFVIMQVHQ